MLSRMQTSFLIGGSDRSVGFSYVRHGVVQLDFLYVRRRNDQDERPKHRCGDIMTAATSTKILLRSGDEVLGMAWLSRQL